MFEIIEEAYRVFDHPVPNSTEVCRNCCMDVNIEVDFFKHPIRRLPLEYIQDWYGAAYDPVTGVAKETWGYLLPRILEILASGEDASRMGLEVSLSRFDTGNPKRWSRREWAVLDRFQRAFLQLSRARWDDYLDDAICMFKLAGWKLNDLTAQVISGSDEQLALRLWDDWCAGRIRGMESIWITAFWEEADAAKILEFYTSDALYSKMKSFALARDTNPDVAKKASAVAAVIRSTQVH